MSDPAENPNHYEDTPGGKVQTPADRYNNVIQQFSEREGEILSMLPSNVAREKFKNAVLSAIKRDPLILNATPRTLIVAFTQAAQDGLLPDGKEGVINNYKGEAKWNPMIGGIRKRARELDNLLIDAQVVYQNDKFVWRQGDDPAIEHEPAQLGTARGEMIGAYAVFKRENGDILHREVMDKLQIMAVKSQSKQQDGLLWGKFETEAWRKTVARRGIKTVPTSEGLMQIVTRDDDNFEFADRHEAPKATITPPPVPKIESKSAVTLDATATPKPEPVPSAKTGHQESVQSRQESTEVGAEEAYQDWLRDAGKELAECLNAEAVEELRERILAELRPGDISAWKDACADRATAVHKPAKR